MRYIDQIEVKKKYVLLRVDFNVPLGKNGKIANDMRLRQVLPTINYLLENKAKVIIISHRSPKPLKGEKRSFWGRLFSRSLKEGSLVVAKDRLSSLLKRDVKFVNDCIGENVKKEIAKMKEKDVLLLENLRFHEGEEGCLEEFAKELASLADVYINDAFSVAHREHASMVLLPRFIPSAAGIMMEKELRVLSRVQKNPESPVVVIIGGAKIKSKIKVINYFLKEADHVLIGGKIVDTILAVKKINLSSPWPSEDIVDVVEKMEITSPKLHLPLDVSVSSDKTGEAYVRETAPGRLRQEEDILDIGTETRKMYKEIIRDARTIIWAGPMGYFEEKRFSKGTHEIAAEIARNHGAVKIIGGGDTSNAILKFGFSDKIDHISCGGGALLNYMSKGPMPGVEALLYEKLEKSS